MRDFKEGQVLKGRAIAGLHVVILAWDFVDLIAKSPSKLGAQLENLMGFAIERSEFDSNGELVERYMLRGIKRFEHKDQGLPPGSPVPLDEHPVQTFQWGDYTANPGRRYDYRIVPMRGKPKLLVADDAGSVTLSVTTEPMRDPAQPGAGPRHDIHFNRGVIGSQAFERRFPDEEPDPERPTSELMQWLSRGLFEGLTGFIAEATGPEFSLRCAFYEFRYLPVARELRAAADRGVDVKIVYDAESSYKVENIAMLKRAELFQPEIQRPRTVTEGIRHNKFMVLLKNGQPIAVWTGSTNISAGGIFGHSNVGHAVWDTGIAAAYLAYWDRLEQNLTPTKIREPNNQASPLPNGKPPANAVLALFSARDTKETSQTLKWYAARMGDATRVMCFTVAFNLDAEFQSVISRENDVLRYIVKDDDLAANEHIGRDHDVLFAAGGRLDAGALNNFLAERDNPLNSNDYIHTKIMLVDPLGNDPLTITGSANFSRPSQLANDENMLVIRGNTRVADVYFGEFMRIFDHHYARYIVKKLREANKQDPSAGYLKETPDVWTPAHFDPKSTKSKRRRYFTEH